MIPGRTLHRLAAAVCTAKSLERVVEPAIADLQQEYAEAAARPAVQRMVVLISGYEAVLEVMIMSALDSQPLTSDERHAVWRMLAWTGGIVLAVAALLITVLLASLEPRVSGLRPWHLLLAFPITLPFALPFGLLIGITFGLGDAVSRRTSKIVLAAGVAASLVSMLTLVSAGPMAARAFRNRMTPLMAPRVATVPIGMRMSELERAAEVAQSEGYVDRARRFTWNYHMRWAMALAPLLLSVFWFAVKGRWAAIPRSAVLAACGSYFLLFLAGLALVFELRFLPPMAAAWMPNAVFAAVAALLLSPRMPMRERGLVV